MDQKHCYSQRVERGHWAQAAKDSVTDDLLRHTDPMAYSFSLPLAKIWEQGQVLYAKVLCKSII